MKINPINYISCLLLALFVASCTSTPSKYLASEVCLVKKGEATRKDILELLGKPAKIEARPDGAEDWYYFNVEKSVFSQIPYAGKKLVEREIEVVRIQFKGDFVSDCCYTLKKEDK